MDKREPSGTTQIRGIATAAIGGQARRLAIGVVLACAFALAMPLAAMGQSGRETLVVNTTEDLLPPVNTSDVSIAACVNDTLPAGAVQDVDVDETINETVPDEQEPTVPGDPVGQDIGVRAGSPCSLRMAIIAANALSPTGVVDASPGDNGVNIDINLPKGETLQTLSNLGSLPPITGHGVTINGCAHSDNRNSTTPCVNLSLEPITDVADLTDASSVAPEGSPGLVAAGTETVIQGIAFQHGNGPAILAPPPQTAASAGAGAFTAPNGLTVRNSWFGLEIGHDAKPRMSTSPPVGIQLSGTGSTNRFEGVIGGTKPADRNIFSGTDVNQAIGILIAGGNRYRIQGNWFGTDAEGKLDKEVELMTAVKITGLGANGLTYAEQVNDAAGQELIPENKELFQSLARENVVGGERASASPSVCDGACNVFAGIDEFAIDVGGRSYSEGALISTAGEPVGALETKIEGNHIGVDAAGSAAPNGDRGSSGDRGGILVRNGSRATTIGGTDEAKRGNLISFNRGPGVMVRDNGSGGTGDLDDFVPEGAGDETKVTRNIGWDNTGLLIDLGDEGVGNGSDGPSGGVEAPTITSASTTSVSGTSAPGTRTIDVYLVRGEGRAKGGGDVAGYLGSATPDSTGRWSAAVSAPAGSKVTATADLGKGTSELAANVAVPIPLTNTPPPPPPDTDPPEVETVLGQDAGAGPVVVKRTPKQLEGSVSDASGVAKVRLALQVLKVKKGKKGKKGKRNKAKRKSASKQRKAKAKRKQRRAKRKNRKGKRNKCAFIHLKKGKKLRRSCDRPRYFPADLEADNGEASWVLELRKKVRKRIKPGRYLLYIETTDANGNTAVQTVKIKQKKRKKNRKKNRRR